MTVAEMLVQSGILTALGMGVVFSFLIIMILGMTALHAVVHALKLDRDAPAKKASAPSADNGAIVAAIAAAIRNEQ